MSKLPQKAGIYIGAGLRRALQGRISEDDKLSGMVNDVADRYAEMVERSRPSLSEPEWFALCDALNGAFLQDYSMVRLLWAEIEDCEGLGEKWGIEQGGLSERLRQLPFASLMAIADTVERWWRSEGGNEERLKAAFDGQSRG